MLKSGCNAGYFYIWFDTSLKYNILNNVRYRNMRELTQDEIDFLDEMSDLNFEKDFEIWIEHMEESFS